MDSKKPNNWYPLLIIYIINYKISYIMFFLSYNIYLYIIEYTNYG